jgi:hypothetical protein
VPLMFSFPADRRKPRALLRLGDSQWSSPQSFDAIGSTYNVSVPSSTGRKEMNIGVSIEEGEGKVWPVISSVMKKFTKPALVQSDKSHYHCAEIYCQVQTRRRHQHKRAGIVRNHNNQDRRPFTSPLHSA